MGLRCVRRTWGILSVGNVDDHPGCRGCIQAITPCGFSFGHDFDFNLVLGHTFRPAVSVNSNQGGIRCVPVSVRPGVEFPSETTILDVIPRVGTPRHSQQLLAAVALQHERVPVVFDRLRPWAVEAAVCRCWQGVGIPSPTSY